MKRPPTLESLIDVTQTPPVLPHKPRGHSSAFSGGDAGAYKAPRILVFSPYGLHHHRHCPSLATSLTCVLASPSQSRRNNSSPSCSTVHVPGAPDAGELLRGGDSADYVANWGSKGVRGSHSALVLRAAGHLVVHLCRMLSNV